MSTRVPRGSEKDRRLRGLGWRRTRRRKRSNAKQPEVWKQRKVWKETGRELIVRITRHNELYRPEVVRVRSGSVYWQPLRGLDFECPLALAMFIELECRGDPVRACYAEAKAYVEDESDWIPAPPNQMPRIVPTAHGLNYKFGMQEFTDAMKQAYWTDQAESRAHRAGVEPITVQEMDFSRIESRLEADLKAKMAGAICPEIGSTRIYNPTRYNK